MNNSPVAFHPCGIEVSQHALVVALRAGGQDEPPRGFPNTPPGHQAVLRWLARGFIYATKGRHTIERMFPLPKAEPTTTMQASFASKAYTG